MSRQDRNKGNVTALVFGSSQFIGDKTPTPTRLIRDCEEIGLFDDLQKANLFEESFRRRVELGSNHQSSKVNTSKGDVLLTPTIFATSADSPSDLSVGAVEAGHRLLTKDSLLEAECYQDQKFGMKETSMTDSDMSDVSSTKTTSSVQPLDDCVTIFDSSLSGSSVISQPLELSNAKLKLKSSIMLKSAGKNVIHGVNSRIVPEVKEKARSRSSTHPSFDPDLPLPSDKDQLLKRERNRVAAMRSRKKRKTWVEQLEKSAGAMQMLNNKLQTEVTCLRAEVSQLKTLLLAHKDCPVTKAMTQDPEPVEQISALEQLIPDHFLAQLEKNVSNDKSETANSKLRVLLQQKLNNSKPVEIAPVLAPVPIPIQAAVSSTASLQPITSSTLLSSAEATQSIVVVVKTPNSSEPIKRMTLSNCDLDKFIPVIKCNPNAVAAKSDNSSCESFISKARPKTKS